MFPIEKSKFKRNLLYSRRSAILEEYQNTLFGVHECMK